MKEELEKVLKECENMSDKVKAYVILAVTDEKISSNTRDGINAIDGSEADLVNLILNIDEDLFRKAVIARAMSEAKVLFDDDDEEERTVN